MMHDHEKINSGKVIFGFWVFIMSDCLLFASLFATYAVLRGSTFGGSGGAQLFNMPFVLLETLILLTSSFTCGLALLCARRQKKYQTVLALVATLALGLSFISLEFSEFSRLVQAGNSWQRSAFLSSYFSLVGTHGLHVLAGSLWVLLIIIQILYRGLSETNIRRLTLWTLFWHFLEIVWLFIFSIVYLIGSLG